MELTSERDFHIVPVTADDARRETDVLEDLRDLVMATEEMYPCIEKWFREKVVPGLRTGARAGYIGYSQGKPFGSAIVKHGSSAKFCHLRIDESLRENHFGELFFLLLTLEVMQRSEKIHFTLPESLWSDKRGFFESFGFSLDGRCSKWYRASQDELVCSSDIGNVWGRVAKKLPKLQECLSAKGGDAIPDLLFSVSPRYAFQILDGRKTVELRRRFSKKWVGSRMAIYATSPVQAIIGEATIEEADGGAPEDIWARYSDKIGCDWKEFSDYSSGRNRLFAIKLSDINAYKKPIEVKHLNRLMGKKLRPPQSYSTVKETSDWHKAMSVTGLLSRAQQMTP